ncbi:MAG TPA: 6-bladed beta-propeller [Patescibacteria group bacterium]|nr:6-bladed beta-propeller [Patescibacteria group bacterium]
MIGTQHSSQRARFSSSLGRRAVLLVLYTLLGLVALCGCRSHQTSSGESAPAVTNLSWPSPPDTARIALQRIVYRPADLGVHYSALARVGRWLTGSEKGNERLIKPFSIALDEGGNLCVTDTGAKTVCFYDRQQKRWRSWNKLGPVSLRSPVAVTKHDGKLYVADSALGQVLVADISGKLLLRIGKPLARPVGLAISGEQLFVTDSLLHKVMVFDLQGNMRKEFGARGKNGGEFNFPTHIATDAQGDLFVTDSMNNRIQIFSPNGAFKGQIGSAGDGPGCFSRPKGVAVDTLGHVYVVDSNFDNIQIFDRQGQLLLTVGQSGSNAGEFWLANGIAISPQNEIFVADAYNHRIQIFKYVGPS